MRCRFFFECVDDLGHFRDVPVRVRANELFARPDRGAVSASMLFFPNMALLSLTPSYSFSDAFPLQIEARVPHRRLCGGAAWWLYREPVTPDRSGPEPMIRPDSRPKGVDNMTRLRGLSSFALSAVIGLIAGQARAETITLTIVAMGTRSRSPRRLCPPGRPPPWSRARRVRQPSDQHRQPE